MARIPFRPGPPTPSGRLARALILLAAAALVPAPPVVLPLLAAVCIGSSMVAGHELPAAIAGLRRTRRAPLDRDALDTLRGQLDQLPETQHPLGF